MSDRISITFEAFVLSSPAQPEDRFQILPISTRLYLSLARPRKPIVVRQATRMLYSRVSSRHLAKSEIQDGKRVRAVCA